MSINAMHAKPDLRVEFEHNDHCSGSVIFSVIDGFHAVGNVRIDLDGHRVRSCWLINPRGLLVPFGRACCCNRLH